MLRFGHIPLWDRQMLILTRRIGETLMIGDEISVTVVELNGNQVRLGINAPKVVAVHSEEVYERVQAEMSRCIERKFTSVFNRRKCSKGVAESLYGAADQCAYFSVNPL